MKLWKRMLVMALVPMIVLSMAGCSSEEDFEADLSNIPDTSQWGIDFEAEIEDFDEQEQWAYVEYLRRGEEQELFAASLHDDAVFLCTDEDVATVDRYGNVTGEGKGTCYVILIYPWGFDEYKYDVYKVVVGATLEMRIAQTFGENSFAAKFVKYFIRAILRRIILGPIVALVIVMTIKRRRKRNAQQSTSPNQ